jgi:hypothetical protein
MYKRTILSLLAACAAMPASAAGDTLEKLGWLQGCWAAAGGEPGSAEHWMAPAGGTMLGMSRTVRKGRTVAYEFIRIEQGADGRLVFIAQPSGQPQASFPLVREDGDAFVFENPAHDFPQRVIYRRVGEASLHARIEGKGKGIDFPMARTACSAK